MKKYYIIELGGDKEISEMIALELKNLDQAITWIQDSMESDSEYFNINITCDINILEYKQHYFDLNFYAKALVCIEYDSIVTHEMMESDIYAPETIIESNLSIVSKIITKLIEK